MRCSRVHYHPFSSGDFLPASIKSRMSLPRDPFPLSSGILVRVGFKKMFGYRLIVAMLEKFSFSC